jgi:hypothetical protein
MDLGKTTIIAYICFCIPHRQPLSALKGARPREEPNIKYDDHHIIMQQQHHSIYPEEHETTSSKGPKHCAA